MAKHHFRASRWGCNISFRNASLHLASAAAASSADDMVLTGIELRSQSPQSQPQLLCLSLSSLSLKQPLLHQRLLLLFELQ